MKSVKGVQRVCILMTILKHTFHQGEGWNLLCVGVQAVGSQGPAALSPSLPNDVVGLNSPLFVSSLALLVPRYGEI